MLSKGANHDLQDINGCTVAHVLVVFDLMRMWDMVVECGAAINIENRQKYREIYLTFLLFPQ